jgi:hypothetical protein
VVQHDERDPVGRHERVRMIPFEDCDEPVAKVVPSSRRWWWYAELSQTCGDRYVKIPYLVLGRKRAQRKANKLLVNYQRWMERHE